MPKYKVIGECCIGTSTYRMGDTVTSDTQIDWPGKLVEMVDEVVQLTDIASDAPAGLLEKTQGELSASKESLAIAMTKLAKLEAVQTEQLAELQVSKDQLAEAEVELKEAQKRIVTLETQLKKK